MPTGIEYPDVIDLVTYDPKGEEFAVIMHEYRPWFASPARMDELIRKINSYLQFVESGNLVRKFPKAAGKKVRLQLDCSELPPTEIAELIQQSQQLLLGRGITFALNIIRQV